jgi:hypothetical protein
LNLAMTFLVRLPRSEYPTDAFAGFGLGEFTLLTARAGAWLAQLAYEDEPTKIDAIISDWGLETVALFKPGTKSTLLMARTRGFVLRGGGAHFVAFAGTDPLVTANWIANFDFGLDEYGIHQGFDNALDAAWKDISQALGAEHRPEHLILAGHSLGGPLQYLLRSARSESCASRQTRFTRMACRGWVDRHSPNGIIKRSAT